jgi:SAM-dependent methyltransferase
VPFAEYKRLLTEAYDLDKPEAPEQELARWMQYARDANGPVLEVMCGSGRFLVPLAQAGIDIDGVDASDDMLEACIRKCKESGVTVSLTKQFVQDLDLRRRYALAFIAAGSFGLLIDEHDYRVGLRRVYEHLEPDGDLILEAETPALAPRRSGRWFGRWWDRPDGARIVLRDISRYDPAARVEEGLGIYELWTDGRLVETEMNNWLRRFWTDTELADEMRGAGFVAIDVVVDEVGMLLARARRPAGSQ